MENFINYPAVRFRKTSVSHDELYRVFCQKENDGLLWRNCYFQALEDDNAEILQELTKDTNVTFLNYILDMMINAYSLNKDYNVFLEILKKSQLECDFIRDISINDNNVLIHTSKGKIFAARLTSSVPEVAKFFPDIETEKRYGVCHIASMKFAKQTHLECSVATGYIAPLSEKNSILHSWIEFNLCGEDMVIDFTRGMMFDKSGYYLLKNINGPVYKISQDKIKQDEPIINYLTQKDPWLFKLYFANRKEAIAIYKKFLIEDMMAAFQEKQNS